MSEKSLKSILRCLIQRRRDGYVAGRDSDGEHVALAVEGGGMRGVASGGMVTALEDLGLTDCFDSIHGSSAGAAAAAYFCCGRAREGTRIYWEDLTDERFISKLRILRGSDPMDTSYLVDNVMQFVKPVDFEDIREKQPRLNIVMTNIDSGESIVVNRFNDYDDYRNCLKASITLPFIAGGPRNIRGQRVMDGGLVQQIPIQSALEAGATKILALMTRRHDEQFRPNFSWSVAVQSTVIQALYGGKIGALYRARNASINASVRWVEKGTCGFNVELAGIRLHNAIDFVHRLTQDPQKLQLAADISRDHVVDVFQTGNDN